MAYKRAGLQTHVTDDSQYAGGETAFEPIGEVVPPVVEVSGNVKIVSTIIACDPLSLEPGELDVRTVSVSSAVLGDLIVPTFDKDLREMQLTAYVSENGIVIVQFCNITDGVLDLPAGNLKVNLIK